MERQRQSACVACRLAKCLAVGMNPKYIQKETQPENELYYDLESSYPPLVVQQPAVVRTKKKALARCSCRRYAPNVESTHRTKDTLCLVCRATASSRFTATQSIQSEHCTVDHAIEHCPRLRHIQRCTARLSFHRRSLATVDCPAMLHEETTGAGRMRRRIDAIISSVHT